MALNSKQLKSLLITTTILSNLVVSDVAVANGIKFDTKLLDKVQNNQISNNTHDNNDSDSDDDEWNDNAEDIRKNSDTIAQQQVQKENAQLDQNRKLAEETRKKHSSVTTSTNKDQDKSTEEQQNLDVNKTIVSPITELSTTKNSTQTNSELLSSTLSSLRNSMKVDDDSDDDSDNEFSDDEDDFASIKAEEGKKEAKKAAEQEKEKQQKIEEEEQKKRKADIEEKKEKLSALWKPKFVANTSVTSDDSINTTTNVTPVVYGTPVDPNSPKNIPVPPKPVKDDQDSVGEESINNLVESNSIVSESQPPMPAAPSPREIESAKVTKQENGTYLNDSGIPVIWNQENRTFNNPPPPAGKPASTLLVNATEAEVSVDTTESESKNFEAIVLSKDSIVEEKQNDIFEEVDQEEALVPCVYQPQDLIVEEFEEVEAPRGNLYEKEDLEVEQEFVSPVHAKIEEQQLPSISKDDSLYSGATNYAINTLSDNIVNSFLPTDAFPTVAVAAGDEEVLRAKRVWSRAFASGAKQSGANRFVTKSYGSVIGADIDVIENKLVLGAAFSTSNNNAKVGGSAKIKVSSNVASVYGKYNFTDKIFANGDISYGLLNIKGLPNSNKSKGDLFRASAFFGHNIILNDNSLIITPKIGTSYDAVKVKHKNGDIKSNNLSVNLGISASTNFKVRGNLSVTPSIHGGGKYIVSQKKSSVKFSSTNYDLRDEFAPSYKSPKDMYNLGGSVNLSKTDSVSFKVGYDLNFRKDYKSHSGFVKLEVKF